MDDLEPQYEYSQQGFAVNKPIQYFAMAFRNPNTIRLINIHPHIASAVQEKVEQLLPVEKSGYVCFSDYHTGFTGRFNIYDLVLEKPFFKGDGSVAKEDATLFRVALCRVLGVLYCIGYDVIISSDVTRTRTNGTMFFKLRDPQVDILPSHYYSHKFVCVAPYSTDTLLLINIPKTMLEKVIKVIHLTWSPGVKSKQTLADDNRSVSVITSLKIHGHPWSQAVYNSGKATIQSRIVMLEIIKIFAENNWRLATNVNIESTADSLLFQWCPNLDMEDWRFCAISLNRYDRLRLARTPIGLVGAIKEAVIKHWYLGLQKQRDYHGMVEFKLGGCPWWADSNDAVESRYFISSLIGLLRVNGWQVCGTMDLTRKNNDKTTFVLRQCAPKIMPHMCISLNKTNRVRLIVSSTDISEDAELRLTSMLNETIKNYWVALGPRNYGKSIEWKLEGDPWVSEGLYSDSTRGIYLLCLILQAITPLGWRLTASGDIAAKNLDNNDRYSYEGLAEDMHTWFFLYDEKLAARREETQREHQANGKDLCSSTSVPNLEVERSDENLYYPEVPTRPVSASLQQNQSLSRSVPGIPAAASSQPPPPQEEQPNKRWLRSCSNRAPSLACMPRQKSLDSSLAAAQQGVHIPAIRKSNATHSQSNLREQYPSNSTATFSTFRSDKSGQCYANRHTERRRHDSKHNNNGYKSDGYRSDGGGGYKSDGAGGYQSDGAGYKSDGPGYKSDGATYKSENGGDSVKRKVCRNRYPETTAPKGPSRYEMDRRAARGYTDSRQANGDVAQPQYRAVIEQGDGCCSRADPSRSNSRASRERTEQGPSRSSSRGGYRESDPEQEIEIQLRCIGQEEGRYGGMEEEEIMVVTEESPGEGIGSRSESRARRGAQKDYYRSSDRLPESGYRSDNRGSDGGESRTQSRNGYKSDGSLQDSPLNHKSKDGKLTADPNGYAQPPQSRNGRRRANNAPSSHSATHLAHNNPHYAGPHQRLVIHPTKHLEASRSFHTFQRQESTTSFLSTHSAPNQPHSGAHNLMQARDLQNTMLSSTPHPAMIRHSSSWTSPCGEGPLTRTEWPTSKREPTTASTTSVSFTDSRDEAWPGPREDPVTKC